MGLSNDSITLAGSLGPSISNLLLSRLVIDPDQLSIGSRVHQLSTGDRIVGTRPRLWPFFTGWTFTFELSDPEWTWIRFRTGGLGLFLQQMATSPFWTVTKTKTTVDMVYGTRTSALAFWRSR